MLAGVFQEGNHPQGFLQSLLGSGTKPFAPGAGCLVPGCPAEHHRTWGQGPWLEGGCGEPLGYVGLGMESSPGPQCVSAVV